MTDRADEQPITFDPRLALVARLRAARETKGISLEDIADRTRISVPVLTGYEEGDFTIVELPYVRAHLRSYARIVGVPVEDVAVVFPEPRPAAQLEQVDYDSAEDSPNEEREQQPSRAPTAIPWKLLARIVLVAVALAALWMWHPWVRDDVNAWRLDATDESVSGLAGDTVTLAAADDAAAEDSFSSAPVLRPLTRSATATSPYPASVRTMGIEATDTVWVHIASKDGMVIYDAILAPGQRTQLDVDDTLRVTLGRYWAARLVVNGQTVETPRLPMRNMVFFLCTPSGIVCQ